MLAQARPDRLEVAKMDKQVLVAIALALLLIVSGVQAIEIGNLKEAIAEGQVITGASAGQQGSSVPAQQSAPAMVGAC